MSIIQNLKQLKASIPGNVELVAVSKTKPPEDILEAYKAGQRIFGENKVQEMIAKHDLLPTDIEWHQIGHLQTNKVKFIAPFVSLIQSVDSLKLLNEINIQALKNKRVIDCLLQIYIATEESKFGLSIDEAFVLLDNSNFQAFQNVRITGVMGMASFTENSNQVRKEFRSLYQVFNQLKSRYFESKPEFCKISMGMSGDYAIAIDEGANIIRVGSLIFGERK